MSTGTLVSSRVLRRVSPTGATYSSTTTWALLPVIPKELTPTSRDLPLRGTQSINSVLMKNGESSSRMNGLSASKRSIRGSLRCFSIRTVLMREAGPAAPSRYPMFALVEPMAQKPVFDV